MTKKDDFLKLYRVVFSKIGERYQKGACDWAQLYNTPLWQSMMATQKLVMEYTDHPDNYPDIDVAKYKETLRTWYNQNIEIILAYAKAPQSEVAKAMELAY